jgi:hypothetical protein
MLSHDPCIFHGCLIPGKPPIYVAIYVDDIIFFSASDEVEQYFQSAFSAKLKVEFWGMLNGILASNSTGKRMVLVMSLVSFLKKVMLQPLWKKWVFLLLISLL